MQLRLQNYTECRQLVETFLRRGMEFQNPRPTTAHAQKSRPNIAADQERLLTAGATSLGSGSQKNLLQARPSPFRPQTLEAGSLSGQASTSPERPSSRSGSAVHERAFSRPSNRDGMNTALVPSHSSAAQMYRSFTTPSQSSHRDLPDIGRQLTSVHQDQSMANSHRHALQSFSNANYGSRAAPDHKFEIPPPSLRVPLSSEHRTSNRTEYMTPSLVFSDPTGPPSDAARPSSSASATLPPREVPMVRPESHHSVSDRSGSRPGSSSLSMPPLPKPKFLKEASTPTLHTNPSPQNTDVAPSRPVTSSPLKRGLALSNAEPVRPQTAASSTDKNNMPGRRDEPRDELRLAPHVLAAPEFAKRRVTPMNELLYGRKPLAEQSTNAKVLRMNSLADAPHEEISPPPTRSKETFVLQNGAISSTVHHLKDASLEEYAAQSHVDRQAALDDFMVAHLENPAFATLCQDVENSWRRIALGL